jgi:hypothetical protein
VTALLWLGLVPTVLAFVGLAATLRRESLVPCHVLTLVTAVFYVVWFTSQQAWMLKTKYLLFLTPAYVLYFLLGLRTVRKYAPPAAAVVLMAFAVLLVCCYVFLFQFAVGWPPSRT